MRKIFFWIIILLNLSCNKSNSTINKAETIKESKFQKFYDSDRIEHFYLDISVASIMKLATNNNKNPTQKVLLSLLVNNYPDSILEPNFEDNLIKYRFKKTELSASKKLEVENIFSQKDSLQTEFSSCLPYYRDIFVFKRNDSIVGIAKVCFDCGVTKFFGSKINTDDFGLPSDLENLNKIVH